MEKLIVPSQDYVRFIDKGEIVLCKSDSCYTWIHLVDGEELVICKSLTKLSLELHSTHFIRVNQSFLVNKGFIKLIDKKKKHIKLINNTQVPFTITLKELLRLLCQ
ncbi:LytTR family transcriptional regulator DNA-binding domain-containing protein [Paradesertivirga mongoliensis]